MSPAAWPPWVACFIQLFCMMIIYTKSYKNCLHSVNKQPTTVDIVCCSRSYKEVWFSQQPAITNSFLGSELPLWHFVVGKWRHWSIGWTRTPLSSLQPYVKPLSQEGSTYGVGKKKQPRYWDGWALLTSMKAGVINVVKFCSPITEQYSNNEDSNKHEDNHSSRCDDAREIVRLVRYLVPGTSCTLHRTSYAFVKCHS